LLPIAYACFFSGTVPKEPPIRLLAMPVPSMAFAFGSQMIIIDIMRYFGMKAPVRISSLPRGSALRPGIYSIIEDVCAVDGSGGTEFRQRLNLRYQASHYFRQMLHRLTLFWAFGALAIATVTTVLIFTVNRNVAYVVSLCASLHPISIADFMKLGWTVPFGWALVWAALTTLYVQKNLKKERKVWAEERAKA
jgi:hypothetical protein